LNEDEKRRKAEATAVLEEQLSRLKILTTVRRELDRDRDGPRYELTEIRLWDEARALLNRTGGERLLIVVDSIATTPFFVCKGMAVEEVCSGPDDLAADVKKLRCLGSLARRLNDAGVPTAVVPIMRVSSKRPGGPLTFADIRGSSDLPFEADSIVLLWREAEGRKDGDVTRTILRVAKNRDRGSEGEVILLHHHRVSTFRDPAAAKSNDNGKGKGSGKANQRPLDPDGD
jgi:hypothetical protein